MTVSNRSQDKESKSHEGEDHLDKQPGWRHSDQQPPCEEHTQSDRCAPCVTPFAEAGPTLIFVEGSTEEDLLSRHLKHVGRVFKPV